MGAVDENESNPLEDFKLYRYTSTHQNKETNEVIKDSDWIYLDQTDYDSLVFEYINTGVYGRASSFFDEEEYALVGEDLVLATESEEDAYNFGVSEGKIFAIAEERMENWNGSAFRLDRSEDSEGSGFIGIKVFVCGLCGKHDEFTEAATLGANMYLSILKEGQHNLWHICKVCAND